MEIVELESKLIRWTEVKLKPEEGREGLLASPKLKSIQVSEQHNCPADNQSIVARTRSCQ